MYAKAGALYAVEFDVSSLTVTGTPRQVQADVSMAPMVGSADFALSRTGLLVYAPGGEYVNQYRLVWVDRQGRAETILEETSTMYGGVLSPDERVVLLQMPRANDQIVSYDLSRRVFNTLTTTWDSTSPGWSEDGRTVFAVSNKERETPALFSLPASGGGLELLLDRNIWVADRKAVGNTLAVQVIDGATRDDIWLVSVKERSGRPLLNGPFSEGQPALSPDGQHLAFTSDRSGRAEVYLIRVAEPDAWIPVSSGGGVQARWSPDGRGLYYRDQTRMVLVPVSAGRADLAIGAPVVLFDAPRAVSLNDGTVFYDVARDGRFLMIEALAGAASPTELTVVTNWISEVRRALTEKR